MNDKQMKHAAKIINKLIDEYGTLRQFSRHIDEDQSDIIKWRYGRLKVKTRALVKILERHPHIKPSDLRPDWFPANLSFKWS